MGSDLNGWIILFIIAASQGLLIGLLLIVRKPQYRWLGIATVLFSVLLGYYILFWTGNLQHFPPWTGILMGIPYLMATCMVMQSERIPKRYIYGLLTPFWLYVSYFLISIMKQLPWQAHSIQVVLQCLIILGFGAFAVHASTNRRNSLIAWLFLGFAISHTLYYVLQWTNILTIQQDYFVSLAGALFIYGSAYSVFFISATRKEAPDELQEKMRNILIERIEEDKLYLDNELRLTTLAETTGFSVHQISELINSGGEKFADLINKYRVNEARRLLTSLKGESMSTEEIGYASGFNNKTSFYNHFKKSTGLSPMKYRLTYGASIANN